MSKPKLIIAGPGAGKTYGMVNEIISSLNDLSPARYMVVITYTNSATDNIKSRLAKRIQIPKNLFIGTMHSFLNKFIVIPFSSFHNKEVSGEKLFIQCQTNDIFAKATKGQSVNFKTANFIKKKLKAKMNSNGYITYDQTVSLAKDCIGNKEVRRILSNRIQFLFVDEFQDTSNSIFAIIDGLRKGKKTNIYCVGDPEQHIQSFDSGIKIFENIPILKCANSSQFKVVLNTDNYRSTQNITSFLNHFNARKFNGEIFQQESKSDTEGEKIKFISDYGEISKMSPKFFEQCDTLSISSNERCLIAKKNDVIKRISASLAHNIITPKKSGNLNPIKEIKATLLSTLGLNQTQFCEKYNTDEFGVIKYSLKIFKAIREGVITNENTFGKFVKDEIGLELNSEVPVKIDRLRINMSPDKIDNAVVASNIHNYKGLESDAVFAIAKTHEELKLWLEMNFDIRDLYRDKEMTDYSRLGYVAFSRARKLLCIGCLEQIDDATIQKLEELNVDII
ncbi:AAA family ATPase [Labilibaculum sp. A4]|uniref:UvrD-helicase domain-containing protein n=1 Tax=Labilibaculum euxinus TaxID=2686357 RepID=UPI000F6272AC|nr:UvrD-helicase domain-containing protein [Labilibaculum euxinus]MDQ1772557.1 UvrD-helicase domain-containing protein [Labilibaculum euxinus]MWN78601.1 AAA family ATPase [Labilibaculum euxinus]